MHGKFNTSNIPNADTRSWRRSVYYQLVLLVLIYNLILMYLCRHGVENAMFHRLLSAVFYCAGVVSGSTPSRIVDEIKPSSMQSLPPDRRGVRRPATSVRRASSYGVKRDRNVSAHQD